MIKFVTVWLLTVVVSQSNVSQKAFTSFQYTYSTREECLKYSEFYRKQEDGIRRFDTYCAPSKIPVVVNK